MSDLLTRLTIRLESIWRGYPIPEANDFAAHGDTNNVITSLGLCSDSREVQTARETLIQIRNSSPERLRALVGEASALLKRSAPESLQVSFTVSGQTYNAEVNTLKYLQYLNLVFKNQMPNTEVQRTETEGLGFVIPAYRDPIGDPQRYIPERTIEGSARTIVKDDIGTLMERGDASFCESAIIKITDKQGRIMSASDFVGTREFQEATLKVFNDLPNAKDIYELADSTISCGNWIEVEETHATIREGCSRIETALDNVIENVSRRETLKGGLFTIVDAVGHRESLDFKDRINNFTDRVCSDLQTIAAARRVDSGIAGEVKGALFGKLCRDFQLEKAKSDSPLSSKTIKEMVNDIYSAALAV